MNSLFFNWVSLVLDWNSWFFTRRVSGPTIAICNKITVLPWHILKISSFALKNKPMPATQATETSYTVLLLGTTSSFFLHFTKWIPPSALPLKQIILVFVALLISLTNCTKQCQKETSSLKNFCACDYFEAWFYFLHYSYTSLIKRISPLQMQFKEYPNTYDLHHK